MIKRTFNRLSLLGLAISLSVTPASAFDLGKIRNSPPDDVVESSRNIFDIERCMIDVDAVSVATVYRQPDRPKEVTLAWWTAIVVTMEQAGNGTLVELRFQSPGGRKARKRLLACSVA